jgi:protein-disulfide isomerase
MDFSSSGSGSADLAPIIEKQELFEKKLNQINKKLDLISDALKKGSIPPAQANNKPKQNKRKPADPNYVHNIPQGDSYFMGNPNAKVTITEFYDFQ